MKIMALSTRRKWCLCIAGAALVYIGSFFYFRATALEMRLANPKDTQSKIVLFTRNSNVHEILRGLYYPMIQCLPGHRYYPSKSEHRKLMSTIGPEYGDPD